LVWYLRGGGLPDWSWGVGSIVADVFVGEVLDGGVDVRVLLSFACGKVLASGVQVLNSEVGDVDEDAYPVAAVEVDRNKKFC
jgi:hypothetical protein